MISVEQIKEDNLRAAAQAASEGQTPLVSWPQDTARGLARNMPYLGDYVPEGWKLEDTYLVDSSGMGADSEPALTLDQFSLILQEFVGHGWAVIEAGQFQVVVGRFTKAPCWMVQNGWDDGYREAGECRRLRGEAVCQVHEA